MDHSKDASLLTANRAKNRYTNILACKFRCINFVQLQNQAGYTEAIALCALPKLDVVVGVAGGVRVGVPGGVAVGVPGGVAVGVARGMAVGVTGGVGVAGGVIMRAPIQMSTGRVVKLLVHIVLVHVQLCFSHADDHSRVKLSYIDDEQGSDYINANYIPVCSGCGVVGVYKFLIVSTSVYPPVARVTVTGVRT